MSSKPQTGKLLVSWAIVTSLFFTVFVFGLGPSLFTTLAWVLLLLGSFYVARSNYYQNFDDLESLKSTGKGTRPWLFAYKQSFYFPFWVALWLLLLAITFSFRTAPQLMTILWPTLIISYYFFFLPTLLLPVFGVAYSFLNMVSFTFKGIAVLLKGLFSRSEKKDKVDPSVAENVKAAQGKRKTKLITNIFFLVLGAIVAAILWDLLKEGFPEFAEFANKIGRAIYMIIAMLGRWRDVFEAALWRTVSGLILAIFTYAFYKQASITKISWWFSVNEKDVKRRLEGPKNKAAFAHTLSFAAPLLFVLWTFSIFELVTGAKLPEGTTYAHAIHYGVGSVVGATLLVYMCTALIGRRIEFDKTQKKIAQLCLILGLALPVYGILGIGFSRLVLYISTYGYTASRLYVGIVLVLLALATLALIIIHIIRLFFKPEFKGWITPLPYFSVLGVMSAMFVLIVAYTPTYTIVARSEIDRYKESGKIDVGGLCKLPTEAAPQLMEFAEETDNAVVEKLLKACVTNNLWASYSVPEEDEPFEYRPDLVNYSAAREYLVYRTHHESLEQYETDVEDMYFAQVNTYISRLETEDYVSAKQMWDSEYEAYSASMIADEFDHGQVRIGSCDSIDYYVLENRYFTPTYWCQNTNPYYSRSLSVTIGVRDGELVIKDGTQKLAEPDDSCTSSYSRCLELGQIEY